MFLVFEYSVFYPCAPCQQALIEGGEVQNFFQSQSPYREGETSITMSLRVECARLVFGEVDVSTPLYMGSGIENNFELPLLQVEPVGDVYRGRTQNIQRHET